MTLSANRSGFSLALAPGSHGRKAWNGGVVGHRAPGKGKGKMDPVEDEECRRSRPCAIGPTVSSACLGCIQNDLQAAMFCT